MNAVGFLGLKDKAIDLTLSYLTPNSVKTMTLYRSEDAKTTMIFMKIQQRFESSANLWMEWAVAYQYTPQGPVTPREYLNKIFDELNAQIILSVRQSNPQSAAAAATAEDPYHAMAVLESLNPAYPNPLGDLSLSYLTPVDENSLALHRQ
jgi:hypothetical protein